MIARSVKPELLPVICGGHPQTLTGRFKPGRGGEGAYGVAALQCHHHATQKRAVRMTVMSPGHFYARHVERPSDQARRCSGYASASSSSRSRISRYAWLG